MVFAKRSLAGHGLAGRRLSWYGAALGLFLVLGCTTSTAPTVTVTVSPLTPTVATSGMQQFMAVVTGTSNTGVTWSVVEAAGGSISAGGLYMAPSTAGTYHVQATSLANSADSGQATVTVTTPAGNFGNISAATSASLNTGLAEVGALGPSNGPAALSVLAASWALQAGVQAGSLTLAASDVSGPRKQRSTDLSAGSQPEGFAFQVTLTNAPQGIPATSFLGILAFSTTTPLTAALVAAPTAEQTIPPGIGAVFIVSGSSVQSWLATAGSESATAGAPAGACAVLSSLPAGVSCAVESFSNASLTITASTAAGGGASGSQTAGTLTASSLPGVALTVDCSQTSLCDAIQVAIHPSSVSLQTSSTQQFTATVTGTVGAESTNVTWSVMETTGCGSITASGGLYSAPNAVPGGTCHVQAVSVADTSRTATATVTVTAAPPVISVSIAPSTASVQATGMQAFTATVTGTSGAQSMDVTWKVMQTSGCGSVASTGIDKATYSAPAVVPSPALCNVVATSIADNTKSATADVTVTAAPPATIAISPLLATVSTGGTLQYTATVTGVTSPDVQWTLNPVTCGQLTLNAGGALFTPSSYPGACDVTAILVNATPSLTASTTVTVTDPFVGTWSGEGTLTVEGMTTVPTVTAVAIGPDNIYPDTLTLNDAVACTNMNTPAIASVASPTTFTVGGGLVGPVDCGTHAFVVGSLSCPAAGFSSITGTGTLLMTAGGPTTLTATLTGSITNCPTGSPTPVPFTTNFTGALTAP